MIRAQIWRRVKHVFNVDGTLKWAQTHAAVPFISDISSDHLTVMFSTRDGNNRSHVGRVHLDFDFNVIQMESEPVLSPGSLGMFDEDGTTASYIIDVGSKRYLYYVGWNKGTTTPFRNALGLAISEDDGKTFFRISNGPIMDRSPVDPCFVAGARVLKDEDVFRMWYISCVRWQIIDEKPRHFYHLKTAQSDDGINWSRNGDIAIDFATNQEYAISQPWVIRENGIYKMWFSHRGQTGVSRYRIGYAESSDGDTWIRNDATVAFLPSERGWDSEMLCYPFVFDFQGRRLMFYNGNEYGRTGFGLAELRSTD